MRATVFYIKGMMSLYNFYNFYNFYSSSNSCIQMAAQASLGMRKSPLGDTATVPTFGPSGRQDLLNCCAKNLR